MEQEVRKKPPRKTSPHPKRNGSNLNAGEALRKLWQTPEFRARMANKKIKGTGTRAGVPDGMRKAEAMQKWAEARAQARKFIEIMEDEGHLPKVVMPDSDEAKAKAALEEMVSICLSPMTAQAIKVSAGRTVLEWTKSKPVQKQEMAITNAEDWLKGVINDHKASDGGERTDGRS
jgi:hypothetical protein